jgi:hypothetical protein
VNDTGSWEPLVKNEKKNTILYINIFSLQFQPSNILVTWM